MSQPHTRCRNLLRAALALLILALVITPLPSPAAAHGYTVQVDGVTVPGTMAEIRDGQLMVSVRPFVEAMGGSVTWEGWAKRVTIQHGGSHLALWVGVRTAFQDGKRLWSPVRPFIKNDRTMVPAWWLAVRLGAEVSYADGTLSVRTARHPDRPDHLLADPTYVFPFPEGAPYQSYYDTMGDPRFYNGRTFPHEGTDILAPTGTPIVAVAPGTIIRYGWNTLGGYRVTIQLEDHPEYKFYYAHMDRYAPGFYLGKKVRAGDLLGYVGSTGEGPERTEGKFVPHLHFGIYGPDWEAVNPYPLLKYWERNKVSLR